MTVRAGVVPAGFLRVVVVIATLCVPVADDATKAHVGHAHYDLRIVVPFLEAKLASHVVEYSMSFARLAAAAFLFIAANASSEEVRTRIAVIDSGINQSKWVASYMCADGHQDVTGKGMKDVIDHGTNIAHIVAKGMDPKTQCLVIIKWVHDSNIRYASSRTDLTNKLRYDTEFWQGEIIRLAVASGAKLVNMSYGGQSRSKAEEKAIEDGLKLGVTFVMAAGNNGSNLGIECDYFPACAFKGRDGVHIVGSLDPKGKILSSSNWGKPVTDWALGYQVPGGYSRPDDETAKKEIMMTGTSQATAIITSQQAKKLQKKR